MDTKKNLTTTDEDGKVWLLPGEHDYNGMTIKIQPVARNKHYSTGRQIVNAHRSRTIEPYEHIHD